MQWYQLLLMLLSAARRSALFGAPSAEAIDGIWRLSPERSKNGEKNVLAFGPWEAACSDQPSLAVSVPRIDGPQLHGWFKLRARLHARMEAFCGAVVNRWHFHDLRRTFRSRARTIGIDRDIAGLILNHNRKGIEGVHDANQELIMRAADFGAWEQFLAGIALASDWASKTDLPQCTFKASSLTGHNFKLM